MAFRPTLRFQLSWLRLHPAENSAFLSPHSFSHHHHKHGRYLHSSDSVFQEGVTWNSEGWGGSLLTGQLQGSKSAIWAKYSR